MDTKIRSIVCKAMSLIEAEPNLPRSPGIIVDGKVRLCAAAAIVYSALGKECRNAKSARDMIEGGEDFILDTAEKEGLDRIFVKSILTQNDSYADGERRDRIMEYLRSHL